ncbi:MAG: hypothetical protein V3U98_04360, partial [Acidobacteriota bacterium]
MRNARLFPRPAELAYGHFYGQADRGRLHRPDVIFTQAGSFSLSSLSQRLPKELLGSLDARRPSRDGGGTSLVPSKVYIAQPQKTGAAGRAQLEALGVEVLRRIGNNVFTIRIPRERISQVQSSSNLVALHDLHPFMRVGALVGRLGQPRKSVADASMYYLTVVLQKGAQAGPVMSVLRAHNAKIRSSYEGYGVGLRIEVDAPANRGRGLFEKLKRMDEVQLFTDRFTGYIPLASVVPSMLMTGHYSGGRRPLYDAGVDGSTQLVAVTDDGMSLDTFSMAHAEFDAQGVVPGSVQPDLDDTNDGPGNIPPDVGPLHRKVEVYARVDDLPGCVVGPCVGSVGTGDFRSCDAFLSGGRTHGQAVATLIAGNPSEGPQGLGITRDDFNQGIAGEDDFHETNIPLDGVARGARIIFQDAGLTTDATICYRVGESDVDLELDASGPGGSIITSGNLINLMEHAGFRTDLPDSVPGTLHARGARLHVLPFGIPNFNLDLAGLDGNVTYTLDAENIDAFLFNFRQYLTFTPAGNDGDDKDAYPELSGSGILAVNPDDPATYQINPPATAKNTVTVGSSLVDQFVVGGADNAESIATYTSKGPATATLNAFGERRVSPLLVSPELTITSFFESLFHQVAVFGSNDNDQ